MHPNVVHFQQTGKNNLNTKLEIFLGLLDLFHEPKPQPSSFPIHTSSPSPSPSPSLGFASVHHAVQEPVGMCEQLQRWAKLGHAAGSHHQHEVKVTDVLEAVHDEEHGARERAHHPHHRLV
jgi:hypothetical protein